MIAATIAVVALSGGCSDKNPGNTGTPAPTAPSSSTLPSDGAPSVTDPITDTSAVETDPCRAIPTAQVEEVGGKVESSRLDKMALGNGCTWLFAGSPSNVNAGLVTGNKDGLSSLYAQHKSGGLTTFKPVDPIEGYPAVIYANGGEDEGTCTLAVGIRNDLVYTVIPRLSMRHPGFSDACGMATKVATAAIKNFKGA
ncbi:DUF3558 domain-containing protein [Amycolatopsis keratiniphila]|uniref:DUF3558 domain-containing protein n=1 Tax=Amycolatopsis keratiniphila TaxID=129921 RepID=R4T4K4_9PSEU|nr:DUF3558 domain-containing protein [Amycolatopsis keratiniphila]AGM10529.1 hypothetical protein AORI_7948 [Amycolatopsis keratiniphila]